MPEFTAVEKGENKAGKRFALIRETDETFGVWALCVNYSGRLRGGLSSTWRYCQRKMSEHEARALYIRKLNGRSK